MGGGALGTEVLEADAGFSKPRLFRIFTGARACARRLAEACGSTICLFGCAKHESREVADEDWLGEWKKLAGQSQLGNVFSSPLPGRKLKMRQDRVVIRIEPGMAFGTRHSRNHTTLSVSD